ncbi:hypothetical protein AABM26_08115 [Curtobacterium aetherium]|uniref:hypothetical protein n=1 Tax=Curtobacterium aetherium TaxID=2841594 RepID=UPI003B51DF4F
MQKHSALAGIGLILTAALACQPLAAHATPVITSSATVESGVASLGVSDWNDIAERASAAGDVEGVSVARAMAARAERPGQPGPAQRNIWTTIAKKAVIQVLRYSVNKLPANVRPYANKIIGVVEDLDQFQQGAVVTALVHVGVPTDVVITAAQWIVVFVGL